MNQQQSINEFGAITGADEGVSRRFLQTANWNLELALSQYFDQGIEAPMVLLISLINTNFSK